MNADNWYVRTATGESIGPLSETQVREKLLRTADLQGTRVRQGSSAWIDASYVLNRFKELLERGVYLAHQNQTLDPFTTEHANHLIQQHAALSQYRIGEHGEWKAIDSSRTIKTPPEPPTSPKPKQPPPVPKNTPILLDRELADLRLGSSVPTQRPAETSTTRFDPYRVWLGVPKGIKHPTYYHILGITQGESSVDVIRSAIEQRRSYVMSKRGEGHDESVHQILSLIEEAAATLLVAEFKHGYDRYIGSHLKEKRKPNRRSYVLPSWMESRVVRTYGEGSGIVGDLIGIVAVLLGAFALMAILSFTLQSQATKSDQPRELTWMEKAAEVGSTRGSDSAKDAESSGSQDPIKKEEAEAEPAKDAESGLQDPTKKQEEEEEEAAASNATVMVTVTPPEAKVLVTGDGVTITGSGANRVVSVENPTGDYRLIATMDGYKSLDMRLQLEKGSTQSSVVTLERMQEVVSENAPYARSQQITFSSVSVMVKEDGTGKVIVDTRPPNQLEPLKPLSQPITGSAFFGSAEVEKVGENRHHVRYDFSKFRELSEWHSPQITPEMFSTIRIDDDENALILTPIKPAHLGFNLSQPTFPLTFGDDFSVRVNLLGGNQGQTQIQFFGELRFVIALHGLDSPEEPPGTVKIFQFGGTSPKVLAKTVASVNQKISFSFNLGEKVGRTVLKIGHTGDAPLGISSIDVIADFQPTYGIKFQMQGNKITVKHVLPGTSGDLAGVKAGDQLKTIDGTSPRDLENALQVFADADIEKELTIEIVRLGRTRTLMLKPGGVPISNDGDKK